MKVSHKVLEGGQNFALEQDSRIPVSSPKPHGAGETSQNEAVTGFRLGCWVVEPGAQKTLGADGAAAKFLALE
jgi:hypothetical protein